MYYDNTTTAHPVRVLVGGRSVLESVKYIFFCNMSYKHVQPVPMVRETLSQHRHSIKFPYTAEEELQSIAGKKFFLWTFCRFGHQDDRISTSMYTRYCE